MSQTYIRTFLVASAAFLALEAGPVVASLTTRQLAPTHEAAQPAGVSDLPRTWMPGRMVCCPYISTPSAAEGWWH